MACCISHDVVKWLFPAEASTFIAIGSSLSLANAVEHAYARVCCQPASPQQRDLAEGSDISTLPVDRQINISTLTSSTVSQDAAQ